MRRDARPSPSHRALAWAVLATALVAASLTPLSAHAQGTLGAGCGGTAVTNISGLDNLIATSWSYLMGGAVTKVIAAALFIFGLFGLFERRAGPIVFGFVGAFIAAFAPTIIKAIFTAAGGAGAALC